jgi:hypothetical protein
MKNLALGGRRSRWRINVGDISKTVCWYPSQRVIVEQRDDGIHPFQLNNHGTVADVARASLA